MDDASQSIPLLGRVKPALRPQLTATAISCIGAVIFGFSLGYSSPAIPMLQDDKILVTKDQQSWFGSIITIGAIFGGPLAGALVDKLGRKTTIMMCCLPYGIGWALIIFGKTYIVLYVGRVICGLGVGMSSLAVPLYIGEVATKEMRGALGAGFQLSVTIGVLLAYGFGFPLDWRWLAVVGSVMTVMLALCMLILPETPRYLLMKHNTQEAEKSLAWLRGPNINVNQECQEIMANLESSDTKMALREITERGIYKPLLISLGLMLFQQLSGVNAVIFYAETIFTDAGFSGDPRLGAVIVGAVQVVATFISCLLMDRLGRKILLIVGGAFMCLSCVAFGVYYYLQHLHPHDKSLNWLPLVSTLVFITAFSLGWGPIPWLVLGELFPIRAKGFASSAAAGLNWLLAFIVTKEFLAVEDAITKYGTYWMFGGICALSVVFVVFGVFETKGKSLEEIQEHFEGRSVPLTVNVGGGEEDPLLT